MAIFKEVVRGDGSGIAEYYRINDGRVMNVDYSTITNKPTLNGVTLSGDLTMEDFGMDVEGVVETLTGEEISRLKKDDNKIVLCTTDYLYTDSEGLPIQTERGSVYEIYNGIIVDKISTGGSGGGGGSSNPRSNFSAPVSDLEQNVSVNAKVDLKYKFVTTAIPNTGTAQLLVNGVMKSTKSVVSGNTYSFNVSSYLKPGINYFSVKTSDSNGAEKTIDFIVNAMQLTISSSFDVSTVVNQTFDFRYRVKGTGDKIIHFILDGEDTTVESNLNDVDLTKQFQYLSHGEHSLEVYATVTLDDGELTSNILSYKFLAIDPASSTPLIMSTFDKTECTEGDSLAIDYLIYSPSLLISDAQLVINDEVISNIKADRFRHIWSVSDYPSGTTTFSIIANGIRVDKVVEVAKLNIEIKEATEGLELYLAAKNRSNDESDETKTTWKYGDIEAELTGFNWESNGWIDNKLKLSGPAQVTIPFYAFNKDIRKNGKTIEIEFTTHDVFNLNSTLVKCIDEGKGFEIKANNSYLGSEQTNVTTRFADGIKVRLSFVIESDSANRLIKTYINGVLSGLKQYASTDNFQQNTSSAILINPDSEEIDISCIRVYDRALSSIEVVNNYIFDLSDTEEKIAKFKENNVYNAYNDITYAKLKTRMPIVTVTGVMPTSKGDKKTVSVLFENANNEAYNFQFDNCTIDVQGTSSQYYPRKNWKIKLPEKVQVWNGAIAENTYTMKADFMESSHSNNVGTANLANTLYNENFPTKTPGSGVRDAIYGFPCAMFLKDSEESQPIFHGTYMFNNDKGNSDTLGLTTDKSESWEFKNNTSDLCLFKTDDFTADDVADNLEARYPDKYTDYTALSRVFSWVVSCKDNPAKFKEEFEQYFNLEYCLVYQVLMEMAMLVDSRAKNMFLDTTDGLIWYPRFYDMDTAWGLNNEGELKWSYDIEIHDQDGSAYVWDERGESVFWNLFEQAYAQEIIDKYHELRESKLTYENIMKYYVDDISSKFSASEYNEDAQFKYINPLTDENNSTYLYAAQGNRQDFFRWLVENRLSYLDSKYEYGDFNSDYATMRLYTKTGSLTISTYATEYVAVKYGSTIVKKKVIADTPTTIPAPAGLEFNDTETIIYGASQIVDFGDLSDKYPGTIDVSKCKKLQRLKIGRSNRTNTNLISLSLGNNPLLREIDVTNCSNLKGNLDASQCSDLRVIKAEGTGLSSISLYEGGNIEELYLPTSMTTLELHNLKNLKKLESKSFSNISTIIYSDCSYDVQDIICKCPGLTRLKIHYNEDGNNTIDMSQFMFFHRHLLGVDDLGYNTEHPNITGKVEITIPSYMDSNEVNEYKNIIAAEYKNLDVTYRNVSSMFKFAGYMYTTETSKKIIASEDIPYFYKQTTQNVQYNTTTSTSTESKIDFYIISKNTSNLPKGNIFLPEFYKGKPVLTLNSSAFESCTELTSITIPDTYRLFDMDYYITETNLRSSATDGSSNTEYDGCTTYCSKDSFKTFKGCTNLETISWKLPEGKCCAGFEMFYNCPNLKYIADSHKFVAMFPKAIGGSTISASSVVRKSYDFSGLEMYYGAYVNSSSYGNNINFNLVDIKFDFSKMKTIVGGYAEFSNYYGPLNLSSLVYVNVKYYLFYACTFTDLNLNNKVTVPFFYSCVAANLRGVENLEYYGQDPSSTIDKCSLAIYETTEENPAVFPNVTKLGTNRFYGNRRVYNDDGTYKSVSAYTDYLYIPKLEYIFYSNSGTSQYMSDAEILDGVKHFKVDTTHPLKVSTSRGIRLKIFDDIAEESEVWKRGFDCSESTHGVGLYNWILTSDRKAGAFGGLLNLGKSYSKDTPEHSTLHACDIKSSSSYSLTKESLINIINGLYDLASNGIPTQDLLLGTQHADLLTDEEIAVATNKGWTVS